jgi:uncharacterized membrane protein YkvI
LLVGCAVVAVYGFLSPQTSAQAVPTLIESTVLLSGDWVSSSILYAAYNLITAVSVLITVSYIAKNQKTAVWSGIVGGVSISVLGALITIALLANSGVLNSDMPMLTLAERQGVTVEWAYILLMLSAIFTTANANAFALVEWCRGKMKINTVVLNVAIILLAIFLSHIGFANFVSRVYKVFGYFGLAIIVLVLLGWNRAMKNHANNKPAIK